MFFARLSPWRGIALLMGLGIVFLALLGFLHLLDISEETIVSWCESFKSIFVFAEGFLVWPSKLTGAQALAGILILLPLGVLVAVQIWHRMFHRNRVDIPGTFRYLKQQNQDAICDAKEDELGRDLFVRHLSSILAGGIAEHHALYIGLHGEWGEGKTSALNLVRRKLEANTRIVFVEFCSWEHEDKKDLPYILFTRIARTVADRLDLRLAFLLFRYAVLLVPRKLIEIAGPFEWIMDLVVRLMNVLTSVEQLRERIKRRLEVLDSKIVVIIDDMDRLEPEDMRNVLRVLRTSGDLSQFVYCLLTARRHLISGIAKSSDKEMSHKEAEEYIQKIIQLEIDLPPVMIGVLEDVFVRRVADILRGYGLPKLQDYGQLPKYFKRYIRTYREMTRLINKLIVRIGFYRAVGESEFPVNMEDLIALTIINLYDADFWHRLFAHRELLQRDALHSVIDDRRLDPAQIQKAFGLDDVGHAEMRKEFLHDYMGVVFIEDDTSRSVKVRVDRRAAELERRMKAAKCFRAYYNGEVPNLPEIGFKNNVLEMLNDEDGLIELFKKQNDRGILGPSLDYLEDMPLIEDDVQRGNYIRALLRMSDMSFKPEQAFGGDLLGLERSLDIGGKLSHCVDSMLRKLAEDKSRGAELLQAFRSTDAVVMMAYFVRWEDRKSECSRDESYFFTQTEYDDLVRLFLERIKTLQANGRLIGYADEENLRRTWRVLFMAERLDNSEEELEEYKNLLADDVKKYPNVLHVLLPYRCYGDLPVMAYSSIWFERLDAEFGVGKILKVLKTALKTNQEEWLRKLIDNFEFSIEAKEERGQWPDMDHQLV